VSQELQEEEEPKKVEMDKSLSTVSWKRNAKGEREEEKYAMILYVIYRTPHLNLRRGETDLLGNNQLIIVDKLVNYFYQLVKLVDMIGSWWVGL